MLTVLLITVTILTINTMKNLIIFLLFILLLTDGFSQTLPASFELKTPSVIDQGSEGCCISCAATYLAASYRKYKLSNATTFSYFTNICSPEYIYDRVKLNSSCTSGSDLFTTLNFMRDTGNVLFSTLPYSTSNGCAASISTPFDNRAGVNRTGAYTRVLSSDVTAIKQAIYTGHVVLLSITADNNFVNAGPGYIWSTYLGSGASHMVGLVGWDDSRNAYLAQNSWGTRWGSSGFIWITYTNTVSVSFFYSYYMND